MNTIKNQLLFLTIILLTFTACVKDNIEDTRIETFDLLWQGLDEEYAGFTVRNVDWDAVRDTYRPQALAAQTEEEFFVICSKMVDDELQDGHTNLINEKGEYYVDETIVDTLETEDVYDLNLIETKYLAEGFEKVASPDVEIDEFHHVIGKIKNENIAYMQLFEMEEVEGGMVAKVDQFIEDIKDTDGLIIDLRVNGGGETEIGLALADRFAATEEVAFNIQTKNGPGHDDFDEKISIYIKPEGASQYTKSIVVLTDEYTASNAEDFTIKLKTQDHITQIGKTTEGIFSNISFQKYLPNGWSCSFSHQLYTYPDGTSPEGVGLIPDIEVIATPADWQGGKDKVLEAAIEFLK